MTVIESRDFKTTITRQSGNRIEFKELDKKTRSQTTRTLKFPTTRMRNRQFFRLEKSTRRVIKILDKFNSRKEEINAVI